MRWSRTAHWFGAALLTLVTGCNGNDIAAAFADGDRDGWFDGSNNLMTVLTLTTFSISGPSGGSYRVVVDGVRFPNGPGIPIADGNPSNVFFLPAPGTSTLGLAVAKRVQGMNRYNGSLDPGRSAYASSVRVDQPGLFGPVVVGTGTVSWSSDGGETRTLTLGGGGGPTLTLTFTSATTRFSDPNPGNASGDSDGDGILESEESALVARSNGLGDPQPGAVDIICIVGFTEPAAALDPLTAELLRTRFFSRAINLHIDSGTLNGRPGLGGLMTLGGAPIAPGTAMSIGQTFTIRNTLPAAARRPTHFVLLAAAVATGEFGLADGIPGSHMVMRATLPLVGNMANYQVGVFMHELGHQLRLCHPTDHVQPAGAVCGVIPTPERDPSASVMGSPAENRGLPLLTAINALARPIDYTPGQWAQLNPVAGMVP